MIQRLLLKLKKRVMIALFLFGAGMAAAAIWWQPTGWWFVYWTGCNVAAAIIVHRYM